MLTGCKLVLWMGIETMGNREVMAMAEARGKIITCEILTEPSRPSPFGAAFSSRIHAVKMKSRRWKHCENARWFVRCRSHANLDSDRGWAVIRIIRQESRWDALRKLWSPQSIRAENFRFADEFVKTQIFTACLQRMAMREIPVESLMK